MMARKSIGGILIMGAALLWIGSEIWAVLGWWTLAVPVVLFAVVLAWAHHASKAALAEQKRLGSNRRRSGNMKSKWPPANSDNRKLTAIASKAT